MPDLKKVLKALECRKNAGKRCGNPCEETGGCHYAYAIRGLDGEIYKPYLCDMGKLCADSNKLLKEQNRTIKILLNRCAVLTGGEACDICILRELCNQERTINPVKEVKTDGGSYGQTDSASEDTN